MRLYPFPLLAAALSVVCSSTSRAQSPQYGQSAAPCFEIIAPQPRSEPRSPVLIDKCGGRTWLLARTRAGDKRAPAVYRWMPLPVADRGSEAADAKPPRPGAAAAVKGNCFTFQNRRYCE